MPLINGMKMSCEPCIRGHRSTKCTHANERLMVPVRKPGRPLSACPHPRDQECGCGSVTAAIPRNQKCHCGGEAPSQTIGQRMVSQPTDAVTDLPSPTKVTFKVQKTRPVNGRKPSFDPANLERIDMNQVNVQPYERPQSLPPHFHNGYAMAGHPQMYAYAPSYALMQPQCMVPIQPPSYSLPHNGSNGYSNGRPQHAALDQVMESSTGTLASSESRDSGTSISGSLHEAESRVKKSSQVKAPGSCCTPKQNGHSHTSSSSSIPEVPEPKVSSCCASKTAKTEPLSSAQSTPQVVHQTMPQNGMHFNPVIYQQFAPQPTVFTYPATYGSFQNPLQPSAWRQSIRTNNFSQSPFPPGQIPFNTPIAPGNLETIHTCGCGDTCQCVGCAAHPYNDATQDYVRSAYNMSQEPPLSEPYTNGHTSGTNGTATPHPATEPASPPAAHTPSSTTSGNGEEQSLSAADFFFVNYPFTGAGCDGETQSCPWYADVGLQNLQAHANPMSSGDDCECLGCTIHRQPIPCAGVESGCACGDDCKCIGCEIHKSTDPSGTVGTEKSSH
ncbi:copper fist DNA binding domain-containing protein [Diplocarpon rosae]|nr:copper fist DNA binding domain-containing protein [Diplocarpon rosae]